MIAQVTNAWAPQLCVLIRCEPHLVGVSVQAVHRLVLLSEVTDYGKNLVAVRGELYAKWDLGDMMGLASAPRSYVLTRVPHRSRHVPMALRVGKCLVIDKVSHVVPLPAGLLRRRRDAFLGVFSVDERGGELVGDVVGVMVDLARLWTAEELDQALERIRVGPEADAEWSKL